MNLKERFKKIAALRKEQEECSFNYEIYKDIEKRN